MTSSIKSMLIENYYELKLCSTCTCNLGFNNIEYRTSIDGYTFSDWIPITQKIFKGRFVQVKINLKSISGHTQGKIKSATINIDVPDSEISIENINIKAGENYISYNHSFLEKPSSIALFTVNSENVSSTYKIIDCDNKGFKVCILDDNYNMISGKIVRGLIRGF